MNDPEFDRRQFLTQMYRRRFDDIDRHIRVVWQSIGAVVGAFAVFSLVEKAALPLDLAVAIVLLLNAWSTAQVIDASYWYNRNLVIIANIEREFLSGDDVTLIHSYFLMHRPGNTMITYLRIQVWLAAGLGLLVLLFHALVLLREREPVSPTAFLPYLVALLALIVLQAFRASTDRKYAEFLQASPGRTVAFGAGGVLGHAER